MWACIFATRKFTVNPMTSIRVGIIGLLPLPSLPCFWSPPPGLKADFGTYYHAHVPINCSSPMFSLPKKKTYTYFNRFETKKHWKIDGCVNLSGRDLKPYMKFNGPSVHVTDAELHHFADEAQGSHKPRRSLNYTETWRFWTYPLVN